MKQKKVYGAGLEWTSEIRENDTYFINDLNCIELIPENFFNPRYKRKQLLEKLRETQLPTLLHGVELSIGTLEPLKQEHFDNFKRVAEGINCVEISDHLCMTEAGGLEIGQLTTLPFNKDVADDICRKINKIQKQISVPFAIENITNLFFVPNSELTETQFINRILERTGCSLLLDITNLYTNSVNHHFNPYDWLDEVRLNTISTIHLAGGIYDEDGKLIDSHNNFVPAKVWEILDYVLQKIGPTTTIVEWTNDLVDFNHLLGEVEKAQFKLDQIELKRKLSVPLRASAL